MDLAGFQVLLFLRETTRKPFLMVDRLSCYLELLWASSPWPGANSVCNRVGLVPIIIDHWLFAGTRSVPETRKHASLSGDRNDNSELGWDQTPGLKEAMTIKEAAKELGEILCLLLAS